LLIASACSSLPAPKQNRYSFPKASVYLGGMDHPYTVLGRVRTKVDFTSLDPNFEEDALCRNYFNKAANDLLERAKKNGGDAVIDMKSVVFLEDGRQQSFSTPQCADDGEEGQVLAQGIVIKWKNEADRKSPPLFIHAPLPAPVPTKSISLPLPSALPVASPRPAPEVTQAPQASPAKDLPATDSGLMPKVENFE